MSEIGKLREAIVDDSISLSSILRRSKVLAYSLKNDELKQWVDNEINGYPSGENVLPVYRIIPASAFGHFMNAIGNQINNVPLPTDIFQKKYES